MKKLLFPVVALAFCGSAMAVQPTSVKPMNPATGTSPLAGPMSGGSAALSVEGRDAFARLDTNNNGSLSRDEAGLDPILSQSFAMADANHDGVLQVNEFAMSKNSVDATANNAATPMSGGSQ